jgi:hypothetical protein
MASRGSQKEKVKSKKESGEGVVTKEIKDIIERCRGFADRTSAVRLRLTGSCYFKFEAMPPFVGRGAASAES